MNMFIIYFDQPRLFVIHDEPRFVMLINLSLSMKNTFVGDEADECIFVILTKFFSAGSSFE
jgi:hypothetical protein